METQQHVIPIVRTQIFSAMFRLQLYRSVFGSHDPDSRKGLCREGMTARLAGVTMANWLGDGYGSTHGDGDSIE